MGEIVGLLLEGFQTALSLEYILIVAFGSLIGIGIGALPGVGSLQAVALLLPLTYKFEPTAAIMLLAALYYSTMYGGAFSAVLINVPGDSPAVITALEGYKMNVNKGRPGQALFISNISSAIGGIVGWIVLVFATPILASFGLMFGPAEMALLLLISMTSITWMLGDSVSKGLVSTALGLLLATMGMDTLSGIPRFSFGNLYLMGGLPFTAVVIGLVGFSEIIKISAEYKKQGQGTLTTTDLTLKNSLLTKNDWKRLLKPSLRGGVIGVVIGVLPGSGATTASFLGYAFEQNFANTHEDELGTGSVEGLAAVESANNAAAAGAFAPLLSLGIPGSGTTAVILGGMIVFGLNPGPLLFTNEATFAWGLIASLFISNIVALFVSMLIIPWILKILAIPMKFMIPSIIVICAVGAYSTTQSLYGVLIMFLAGLVGYIFNKCGYPLAPFILSFVLGPMLESNMRKAFTISGGSLDIFVGSNISIALVIIFLLIVLMPVFKAIREKAKASSN